jgi:hypothetical protein
VLTDGLAVLFENDEEGSKKACSVAASCFLLVRAGKEETLARCYLPKAGRWCEYNESAWKDTPIVNNSKIVT